MWLHSGAVLGGFLGFPETRTLIQTKELASCQIDHYTLILIFLPSSSYRVADRCINSYFLHCRIDVYPPYDIGASKNNYQSFHWKPPSEIPRSAPGITMIKTVVEDGPSDIQYTLFPTT